MSVSQQYATFGIFVLVGIALYGVIMLVSRIMRPSVPSPAKLSTYECGVESVGTGWSQMNIRYYVFAFLFVIFDVEAIFLFPWARILGGLSDTGRVTAVFALVEMFVFIGVLAIGLVYAWRKKVLVWE